MKKVILDAVTDVSPDLRRVLKYYIDLTKIVSVQSEIENGKINIHFETYPPKMYIENNCLCLKSISNKIVKFDEETTNRIRSEYLLNYDYDNNES